MSHSENVRREAVDTAQHLATARRPTAPLSYVAIALGLLSALAVIHIGFVFVAVLGVVVSLLALRQVSRFWPELGGWRIFLCGAESFTRKARRQCFLAGAGMRDISVDSFLAAR